MNRKLVLRAVVWTVAYWGCANVALASAGDVQLKTDHPWYPGELSCSTFDRLFATQAEVYQRATGRSVESEEDKALASWYWRNLHYAHGEEGAADCFGRGFDKGEWNREYWTGLFAHGFGLCGTTHAQYGAEINALLGHCRGRSAGVTGHNSFEVFLTGGAYGSGRWALLDHDVSTVIFDESGSRLLSIAEIMPQLSKLKDPKFKPQRQRGWRVAGLHDGDAGTYDTFHTAEYLAGYAGPPPIVHLRRGEQVFRYHQPAPLYEGKAFVFWGRNYRTAGVPGPERSRSWVNQPEKMFGSAEGAGHQDGRVRFGNAEYVYTPNFADGSYKEGVVDEGPNHVTFEFNSPYVIGCTPPNDKPWGVYDVGGTNGLVVSASDLSVPVSVSTDHGRTWFTAPEPRRADTGIDLTDRVKGRRHYWLRFGEGAGELGKKHVRWQTICQANAATMPQLKDGKNTVTFLAGGAGLFSVGPDRAQVEQHLVGGKLDSSAVTVELSAPRGARAVRLYAAAWQASGNPPAPDVSYFIEYSTDGGKTWAPMVKDWKIVRRPPEPKDFWSQSFCWGDVGLPLVAGPVRVRFRNTGGKPYRTAEAHLCYEVPTTAPVEVTFAWEGADNAVQRASRAFAARPGMEDATWSFDAGKVLKTRSVSFRHADP